MYSKQNTSPTKPSDASAIGKINGTSSNGKVQTTLTGGKTGPLQPRVVDVAEINVRTFTWNETPQGFDELVDDHDIEKTKNILFSLIQYLENKMDRAENIFVETLEGYIYCYVVGLKQTIGQKDFAHIKNMDSKITNVFVDPCYRYVEDLANANNVEDCPRSLPISKVVETPALVVQFCKNDTLIELENCKSETDEDIQSFVQTMQKTSKKRKLVDMESQADYSDDEHPGESKIEVYEPPKKKGFFKRILGLD